MKKIANWENIKESQGGGMKLPAGGYVCRIHSVEDVPSKEYLKIEYDIVHGEHGGYFLKSFNRMGWWGATFYRSYKETAYEMFKGFIGAVERSNDYRWNWEEQSLKGKNIGLVLGEEEYRNSQGELKTRLYVSAVRSVDAILAGDFEVPALKKVAENGSSVFSVGVGSSLGQVLPDEDIPF